MDSRAFYDNYVDRQLRVGVNERHRAILDWAIQFGMEPHHRVLEIGCGVGTVTGLLSAFLRDGGEIVAMDLSPKSIQAARERIGQRANLTLIAGDVLGVDLEGPFQVLVLPDVIEHIPLGDHPRLFERLAAWVDPEGFILLHYPNPLHLEWCHVHTPDRLQFIDQPVPADVMVANAYRAGLFLDFYETYSIWVAEGDYVVAVLRRKREDATFHEFPPKKVSLFTRARQKARIIWRDLRTGRAEVGG